MIWRKNKCSSIECLSHVIMITAIDFSNILLLPVTTKIPASDWSWNHDYKLYDYIDYDRFDWVEKLKRKLAFQSIALAFEAIFNTRKANNDQAHAECDETKLLKRLKIHYSKQSIFIFRNSWNKFHLFRRSSSLLMLSSLLLCIYGIHRQKVQ